MMLTESPSESDVPLVIDDELATIYFDEDDHDVVGISARDLAADVQRVTGDKPPVSSSLDDLAGPAVIVGTLGNSTGVETCLPEDSIDAASLSKKQESFVITTVEPSISGVDSCVLIVGSDKRGTAYGVYELSERIGVSPWYWWADIPSETRESLVVEAGTYREGPPDVTYRGIFLNDEDWGIRPWASETFAPEEATDRDGLGPKTYAKIYELLLRLKANTIWPAMHPGTKAFYRYPENAEVADQYAMIVGTSHCEPMHRNNVDEWETPREEWNYKTNDGQIRDYWRTRVEDVSAYGNIFTIGMRGIHDSGMPGGDSREEKLELLQKVVDDQRKILDEVHAQPAEEIPQVFCPYKEVLDIYRGGLDIPEDVCLMWPDDNFGYIRELPTASESERAGGSGIYYHLSYWGSPHDYLWLSSIPPSLIQTEMGKAYDAGAAEYWIANVGDIKPTEKEMEYFLDLAWDTEAVRSESVLTWLKRWAAREFEEAHAAEIAKILTEYYRLSHARMPEHMGWSTVYPDTETDEPAFSFTNSGDEARRRIETFEELVDRGEEVFEALPVDQRPGFYQLVLHQIRCAALMSEKFLYAARSRLYAGQGRTTANRYAELSERARDRIKAETRYYNETLVEGKWEGMMSDHPHDLPVFDVPGTGHYEPIDGAALGIAIEGRFMPVRRDEVCPPVLPTFHSHVDHRHFVDIYARGSDPVEWSTTTSNEWIRLSEEKGTASEECRIWVGIDWDIVPEGRTAGEVTIEGPDVRKTVGIETINPTNDLDGDFVEINGVVAIEAEHFSYAVGGSSETWERCEVPGRVSGETMAIRPSLFSSYGLESDDAPSLEYDVNFTSSGLVEIEVHCVPTQAINSERDLRYAVALDEEDRRAVSIAPNGGEHDPEWQQNVLRGAAIGVSKHRVTEPGKQTLRLSALDPGLIVDRIIIYKGGERSTYLGPRETMVGCQNSQRY
ncbi:hypothetical protein HALLA_00590 (plasmid) [Halostagnicola larsenii XH-48]|uniref:Gylcosyl hydrolase 115 C-terminal domain-containing protein n=1 Tax=Halostagnicola larsenii XH-48 TaxID=797299 RepID=W0JT68_9EURY|nr:glycosyl hydrolase 115 family protein [Halostagnicola larsenii]AHG01821.1 hypothetical protein HALLA_00590 [Halostagnicola larsenii XH-48]